MDANLIWASVFGVAFIVTSLLLAIRYPNPTPYQVLVFRTTLALAAGGVAASVPGFLEVDADLPGMAIRAGGALAVFLLIYSLNPAKLLSDPELSEDMARLITAMDELSADLNRNLQALTEKDLTETTREQRDRLSHYLDELAKCVTDLLLAAESNNWGRVNEQCYELKAHIWSIQHGLAELDVKLQSRALNYLYMATAGPNILLRTRHPGISRRGAEKLRMALRGLSAVAAALRT